MLAFALSASLAHACDHVSIDAPGLDLDVVDCEEGETAPPVASVVVVGDAAVVIDEDDDEQVDLDVDRGDHLLFQYGLQFLPEVPGHQLSARLIGEKDAYLGAELRYTPGSDFAGVGRLSAGFDVLGRGNWDLTLGLFLGSAGEWERSNADAVLMAAPVAGTEIGFGIETGRLFGKYRWLAGIGGGPVDDLLTENELTLGFKVTDDLHVFGQYLVLSPGELDNQSGLGIGARLRL
ncbi:MAG: hypothetical protein KC621_34690 [Myxococcales bacterium]|nr:hypothetical protein [Myxococcales bacterium]